MTGSVKETITAQYEPKCWSINTQEGTYVELIMYIEDATCKKGNPLYVVSDLSVYARWKQIVCLCELDYMILEFQIGDEYQDGYEYEAARICKTVKV